MAVLGTSHSSWGQATYSTVPLTAGSFTADVVANGLSQTAASASTTASVDNGNYRFMESTFSSTATASTRTQGLPPGGSLSSAATTGLTFQLASYTGNNALRLATTGATGTLAFATPQAASELYVLANAGNGPMVASMTVNFTDGTTQSFGNQTIPDWYLGSQTLAANTATAFLMKARILGTSTTPETTTTDPRLYQIKLTLDPANATKLISGVAITQVASTNTGVIVVVGVSAATYPACTAPPTAGTAAASPASLCAGGTATLTLSGVNTATGQTIQWQSSTTSATTGFTNITGATGTTYTTPALTQTTYYQAVVTCSGQSATSTVATVTVLVPTYATVPYTQGFETAWLSRCGTNDAPDASWLNTPSTGNNSWRRDDDGASAGWTLPTGGAYSPVGSNAGGASSTHSARFHNYYAPSASIGTLDLYLNMSGGTGTPTLKFDFRNSDSNPVVVLLSTDGGATFPTTLRTLGNVSAWTSYTTALPATVTPTTVIRFRATSNYGSYDNGLDNVSVSYVSCAAATGLAATTTAAGATVSASIAFTPVTGAANYAFAISPAVAGAPTSATASPISLTGLAYSTAYTVTLTTNCGSATAQAATYTFTTPCAPPTYATVPYTQGFEGAWLSRCGTNDVPDNSWANTPVTGNNSWRREDDGASAGWSSTAGAYTPTGSQGSSHSARFHSFNAPSGAVGTFDLYLDLSPAGTKRLTFDFVNVSTAGSKVELLLSTDGGATFGTTPLLTLTTFATFTAQTLDLTATSATSVIRFKATSDFGSYDIGVDNVQVRVLPAIDLAATALATPTATQGCYGSAETVAVTVTNQGSAALDFTANPATVTAVVTTPSGPQTLTGSITTGTLAAGATQTVTLAPTLNMTALGTYAFALTATVTGDGNTANDLLTPSPTRTVVAPVAGTLAPAAAFICNSGTAALTLTGAANGSIQYQSSSSATGPFTNISGATSAAYTTPVLTTTTYYRAQVTCGTNVAISNVSTITVNTPVVASTNTPIAICAGTTATLTAAASTGASVRFFSAATGGTALATATAGSYTTPPLTASTTYYAEAYTGGISVAGLADNSASNGTFAQSSLTDYPLGFSVAQSGSLTSVDVYPTAAGTLTVRLYRVSGTQPAGTATAVAGSDVTLTVTAAQVGTRVTVPLNYVLTPGDYKLSNFAGGLGRFSTYSGSYPLTSADGVLVVKGSYTFFSSTSYSNTTYNSFFNLTFSTECISAATRTPVQVNVTQPATATLPVSTDATCGSSPYQLAGTVGGSATTGTYTSSGTGTFSPNATTLNATYTPSAADIAAGSATITLTATASPCAPATATLALSITPAPVATFGYGSAASYCVSGATNPTVVLGTGATAGTFSSTTGLTLNATTGAITLASSTPGTYTVTNTVAASGACAATTSTATVTITAAPVATFGYGTSSTFCVSGTTNPTVTLGAGATAGTFSSTTGLTLNATTGAITLASSTPGTYTVTNTIPAANGCAAATATSLVTITTAPVATFSYPAATTYCAGSTNTVAPTLATGASSGTFSSTSGLALNATTGVITLATSLPGTYTVTNTIAASGACVAALATATVTVAPATSAAFTYNGPSFCVSGATAPAATVTGTAGGTFSSTTGLTLNATTGAITLASSTPGTYTVTYAVAGACGTSSTQSVTITAAPLATFSYGTTSTYCVSGTTAPAVVLGTGATAGTFSSTTGLTLNATTGAITLSSSTPGTYTVTNTIAAANGCAAATATSSVTITAAPLASFTYPAAAICAGQTATVAPALGTGATAGTFSSTTGLTINATTGVISPSTSTAGTYTVTNTVAAAAGCAAVTSTQSVTILPLAVATFSYGTTSTYCVSGTAAPAVVLGTGATAGTFSSTTGLALNATTGAITLASSTPGTYTVTNTVAASGAACANTATSTVTITAAPLATFSYASAAGCAGAASTAAPTLATGATAGTYSSTTGLTINANTGAITLASSTAGTYTVTNTVGAAGGCAAATATTTFTVNPRPAAPVLTATYNGTTTTLTSSAATGNQFYLGGNIITGATGQTYVITGLPAQLGSYTVTTTNPTTGCVSLPSNVLLVTAAKAAIAGTSLKVYPNPTPTGRVTLELGGFRLATQLTVLDALGRVVSSATLPANSGTAIHTLDLSGVATGVYLLRLSNADGVESRRLVRE